MADEFAGYSASPNSFGRRGSVVTPNDSADLTNVSKGLLVVVTGNLVFIPVDNADGAPLTWSSVPVNTIVPYFVRRVKATGTTATVWTIEG